MRNDTARVGRENPEWLEIGQTDTTPVTCHTSGGLFYECVVCI